MPSASVIPTGLTRIADLIRVRRLGQERKAWSSFTPLTRDDVPTGTGLIQENMTAGVESDFSGSGDDFAAVFQFNGAIVSKSVENEHGQRLARISSSPRRAVRHLLRMLGSGQRLSEAAVVWEKTNLEQGSFINEAWMPAAPKNNAVARQKSVREVAVAEKDVTMSELII